MPTIRRELLIVARETDGRRQSRSMSAVEAVANVVVGFVLAFLTQMVAFPVFGLQVSTTDNLLIGGIFTAVSIVRSFALRRLFEALRCSSLKKQPR